MVVIVTEPTPSGLHDLERVADLCDHFSIPATVLVNKCDVNPVRSIWSRIETLAELKRAA
jgi:MinD superfamily P-loop ATPase